MALVALGTRNAGSVAHGRRHRAFWSVVLCVPLIRSLGHLFDRTRA
jgi:hypothetical protein